MGAWIETEPPRDLRRRHRSLPPWERGLKHRLMIGLDYSSSSLPPWERGLKPEGLAVHAEHSCVAPSVGAWIETTDKMAIILSKYPELNRDWILNGDGEMLRELPVGTATKIDAENSAEVRFFEVTPSATFQEFCSGAPDAASTITISYPHGETVDDSSCVFQIYGESMEPQIQSGARILCQEIAPSRWHQIPSSVVVIAYADRFVIKRIAENHLSDHNFLLLVSDNPKFPEREKVQWADIRAIFRARRIIDQVIL